MLAERNKETTMSSNHDSAAETSVMFSLAELAGIERDRVQEEAQARADHQREQERCEHQRQRACVAAEQARIAAGIARREQVERDQTEAAARATARQRATIEVARIEANAEAQLATENALRAHQLEVLHVESDTGRARLRHALAGVIGVLVLVGSAAAWAVNGHVTRIEQESQRLRADRWALSEAQSETLASNRTLLNRRHDTLRLRATGKTAERARLHAEAARSAIEAGGIDAPKLRGFASSLNALELRVALQERIAAADRRYVDLSRWAHAARKPELLAAAKRAAARARAAAEGTAATEYTKALDKVADALVSATGNAPTRRSRPLTSESRSGDKAVVTGQSCANPHDPLCGFDGQALRTK